MTMTLQQRRSPVVSALCPTPLLDFWRVRASSCQFYFLFTALLPSNASRPFSCWRVVYFCSRAILFSGHSMDGATSGRVFYDCPPEHWLRIRGPQVRSLKFWRIRVRVLSIQGCAACFRAKPTWGGGCPPSRTYAELSGQRLGAVGRAGAAA